jgi:hypothetical protein
MTGDTFPVELDLRSRLLVTSCAAQPGVRAGERETRLPGMVKFPHAPAIGGVALLTLLPEASLVDIRLFMAFEAGGVRYPEGFCRMTLLARHGHVQAKKREFRQIVIEVDHGFPTFGYMALVACATQPRAVNVARSMTAHAIRW